MKRIKFNRNTIQVGPIAQLMRVGIVPAGFYTLTSPDLAQVEVELPYFSGREEGQILLLHDVMPERVSAYITQIQEFKQLVAGSKERETIVGAIKNMDFSGGFDFATLLPTLLPLASGGGIKMKTSFSVQSLTSNDDVPVSITDGQFSDFEVTTSVVSQDLLKDPSITIKLASLMGGGNNGGKSGKTRHIGRSNF